MNISDLQKFSSQNKLRKITGPPCDWLKTLNTFSWGFRSYGRTNNAWQSFKKFDVFIFHSMKQEYLLQDNSVSTGIIGIGIMDKKEIIAGEPYDGAFTPEGLRPLKIYFSDMWMLGQISKINNETISEKKNKGTNYIIKDIYNLTYNTISFSTMKENNCSISTQGAVSSIAEDNGQRLMKLILERVHEPHLIKGQ
ncbi:hypothetical protein [Ferroplasma sp.]|uniref:hypothetical protein n=1 Tax=Ferroplasma sp. TaxID=2591003 RepID=UPI00307F111D